MTTAKDLCIIAMDPSRSVGQGDLSLALAGAELVDLLGAGAVAVDGDRLVPSGPPTLDDRLLAEAATALSWQPPYERIEDWLWRRGRDLSAAYQADLAEAGELTRKRDGRLPFGPEHMEPADTPARRRAVDRWQEQEPVLLALVAAVGSEGRSYEERSDDERSDEERSEGERSDEERSDGERPDEEPDFGDEAVATVVATVHDALMELEAVRQRRSIEKAAFANIWRGP